MSEMLSVMYTSPWQPESEIDNKLLELRNDAGDTTEPTNKYG